MAFDRQAALQAGYTEEEIDSYLQNQTEAPPPPAATTAAPGEVMEPPAPTTVVTPAGEGSIMPAVATGGLAAAGAAVPAAIGYGVAKYGGRAMDVAKNMMQGGGSSAAKIPTTMPVNPAAINPAVSPSYAAPSPQPAAAPQQPGAVRQGLQQGMEYANKIRQIAMEKVIQNAGAIGKAGMGAAAMATPGNVGQKYNFPTSGPMRGMEINPQTGRPWTPQELSALGQ